MGALISPLAQVLMGMFMAPSGRLASGTVKRLLIVVLGLAAAALIGSVAMVILTFALVIWVMPPGSTTLEICLITAASLLLLALAIWQITSQGKSPREIVEEVLEPDAHSPIDNLARSARHVLHSFERGWNHR